MYMYVIILFLEICKLRSEGPKPHSLRSTSAKKMSVPGPLLGVSRPERTGVRLAPSYMSKSVRF